MVVVHYPDGHTTKGIPDHIRELNFMWTFAPDNRITEHPVRFGTADGRWTAVMGFPLEPVPPGIAKSRADITHLNDVYSGRQLRALRHREGTRRIGRRVGRRINRGREAAAQAVASGVFQGPANDELICPFLPRSVGGESPLVFAVS